MSTIHQARGTALLIRGVLGWSAYYTRGLRTDVADDRRREVLSDLYEQTAHADSGGLRASLVARAMLGAADDLLWRHERIRRGEVERRALRAHRTADFLLGSVGVLGFFLAVAGVYVCVRVVSSIWSNGSELSVSSVAAVLTLTASATLGFLCFTQPRYRSVGIVLMVAAASALPWLSMKLLYVVSATGTAAYNHIPGLSLVIAGASVGLSLVFTSVLLWWKTRRRGSRRKHV
ncbi:hypothetical protein [Agromyces larvae]|uniref:Uncharacterized protein n=1 Tax=Agromyces larvae TaxID=2929802 RepID=A0ABY4BY83_9MICO|nr:hypothetical protein [Agromyces larvae]UOE43854.1 hypothetical protein MTO99_17060 [Agromyces larvae]